MQLKTYGCPSGKPSLTALAAKTQAKHSRSRTVVAYRCPLCGHWHCGTATARPGRQLRRKAWRDAALEDGEE